MSRDYTLLIGACGWMHPRWEDGFYPEDLPSDWQLGYYANEFRVVLIGDKEWDTESDCAQWAQDSDESLKFIAKIPASGDIDGWRDKLLPIKDRLFAVLLSLPPSLANEELAKTIEAWKKIGFPLCLDVAEGIAEEKTSGHLARHGIGWCWHGEDNAAGLNIGNVAIACIPAGEHTAKQLRHYVETCLAAGHDEREVALLFAGEPPSIETIRNAIVIRDLL